MPRSTVTIAKPKAKVTTASATRRMLQPSIHPLIKDYEAAQDSVGAWFASPGLVRGERQAEAIREARRNGTEPPKRRRHAKTSNWRAQEELRLKSEAEALASAGIALDERAAALATREDEAETILSVADGVASGAFTPDGDADEADLIEAAPSAQAAPPLPTLEDLRRQSPRGFDRAVRAFGRAWARLFGDATRKAEAAAADRIKKATAEIEEADQLVARAALHLPLETRSAIARIRGTIPAILRRFERHNHRGSDRPSPNGPGRQGSNDPGR